MTYVEFQSYAKSVPRLLDALGAGPVLARQQQVIIKPNLVNASPPPVTTPVECCAEIVKYIRRCSNARIIIAEGCGAAEYDTETVFARLGYLALSQSLDVPLLDLNHAATCLRKNAGCKVFPAMYLPAIAFESYILSVPVLKAHTLAGITGTLKNMMGFAPPRYYQQGGHWKKSVFHERVHQAITELNRYVSADLTLLDARVGLAEYHLGGATCHPPVGKLLGGFEPLAVDQQAAAWLGLDWRKIAHLHSGR